MSTARILVINDDPIQLKSTSSILEAAGHAVRCYLDASEALAGLTGWDAVVDLFVVDLHMPGIDGWKLCRLLRSPDFPQFNQTPILIVSATFTGDDVERITHELGANAFLQVPFTSQELVDFTGSLLVGEKPHKAPVALVVEDDEAVMHALVRALEAYGYDPREAATVEEASVIWSRERIDIALLDYHLPDGTCEALLDRFQTSDSSTVALVMTGDSDPDLPVGLLARGAGAYLRKPFDPAFAIELARRASRERSLMRVEAVLEKRTGELRMSERRYQSLFRTVPDMMLLLDETHRIVEANPEAIQRLSRDGESLIGHSVFDFSIPEAVNDTLEGVGRITSERARRFETVFMCGTGEPLHVEVTGRVVDLADQQGMLLMARDVTERVRAEEDRRKLESQLQHAQRLESLGVLAGGVAHDFNNLLVGILGNASLALTDVPEDSPVQECLVQIEVAARRAAELTGQILTFAGKSKFSRQVIHLPDLVREMGQLVEPAVSKKAQLAYRLTNTRDSVKGDPGQIRQVVMNLIMNASDALEGRSGTITVTTGRRQMTTRDLADAVGSLNPEAGAYVFLEVADDGCGMSPDTVERIFEPFFTTKALGRGLGLASTLGIVRSHGGHLLVKTTVGGGTAITVLLPPHGKDGTARRDPAPDPAPQAWTRGGTILVVDDEEAVRGLARAVLSRNRFRVMEAWDGEAGLELLRSRRAEVDLVLLDLTMPKMSGEEVLAAIREHDSDLPVLLSSGYTLESMPEALLSLGPTGFVRKPYAPRDLMIEVSSLLTTRQSLQGRRNIVA